MHIRIEFLAALTGVESLQTVFLQRADQYRVCHFDAVVQGNEVDVSVCFEFVGGHGAEGAVEVVDGLDEVAGKALDGEVFCALDFALCALLQVAEVGD